MLFQSCLSAADKHQKESAEDREALGLDGGSATKKTARTKDTSTFHGQLEVTFCI